MRYQAISLAIVSTILAVTSGMAQAESIEVNTGDTHVSIRGQTITVATPAKKAPPSLLERLRLWRPRRPHVPERVMSTTSNSGKCKTTTSNQQSSHRSGSGIVQSSSSSSSTICR